MADNRPFLDFKAIKARVGIGEILARYRVSLVRVNQTALKGTCPLPSHSSGNKNTFFVNETKSVWYCHSDSCKKNGNRAGGNIIDFVTLMENCSVYVAAKWIDEQFPATGEPAGSSVVAVDTVKATPADPVNGASPGVIERNRPLAFVLKNVNPSHPMIQARGDLN